MIPNINLFGKTISAYMIVACIAIIVSLFAIRKIAKENGLDELSAQNMYLFSFIGAFLLSHIFSAAGKFDLIIELIKRRGEINSFGELFGSLEYIFGGSVFYGGMIGALLTALIYIRLKKLDSASYKDLCAVIVPLFHSIARIGCFLSGCCYGKECAVGFVYRYAAAPGANGVRRFPVQLLECALNFIIFLVILRLFKGGKLKGRLICVYLISYSFIRFFLEFIRGDDYRGFAGALSSLQIVSIAVFVFALSAVIVSVLRERKKKPSAIL